MKISNRVRSAVCVLLYISYTAIYMARLNLSMSSDALTGAGILTDVEYGILGGAFLVVYALGRLFNGWLSDRLPPRTMICAGLLLSGAANIVFSALPPFSGMLVLWSLNAFAQSMLWSPILRVVAAMYDGERAGKITSLMVTSGGEHCRDRCQHSSDRTLWNPIRFHHPRRDKPAARRGGAHTARPHRYRDNRNG